MEPLFDLMAALIDVVDHPSQHLWPLVELVILEDWSNKDILGLDDTPTFKSSLMPALAF